MGWLKSKLSAIGGWLRQPTTIHGIGVIVGGVAAYAASACGADPTVTAIAGGIGYALTNLGISDNTASAAVTKLIKDAVAAAVAKQVPQAFPSLVADAISAASAVETAAKKDSANA